MSENLPDLNDQALPETTEESAGKAKRAKKITILIPCILALIVVVAIFFGVIKPKIDMGNRYNEAVSLLKDQKYDEAIRLFKTTKGYKDTENKLAQAEQKAKDKELYEEVKNADAMPLSDAIQKMESISELSKEDQTRLALWKDLQACEGYFYGTYRVVGKQTHTLKNNWDMEINLIVKEGIAMYPSAQEDRDPAPINVGEDDYDFKVEFPEETIWFSANKARMQNKAAMFWFEKQ